MESEIWLVKDPETGLDVLHVATRGDVTHGTRLKGDPDSVRSDDPLSLPYVYIPARRDEECTYVASVRTAMNLPLPPWYRGEGLRVAK